LKGDVLRAQLRYMLAAGQSAQMSQKNEQGMVFVTPRGCQSDFLPLYRF
jgi:hypothetical protein